jgi:cytoskeletal protein RodZ
LRDLRSVVAAANDPVIERAENCRELVAELRAGLTARADQEQQNWLEDIDAALGVGRIVRALKLAGQPPKAGAIFPDELGRRLAEATSQSLVADALADRWIAVLEAVAFAPIRAQVTVTSKPETITPDLAKTVERLGALLPQIAASLGIAVASTNHAPKPLRAVRPPAKKLPPKPPTAPKAVAVEAPIETASEAVVEAVVAEVVVTEAVVAEVVVEAPAESTPEVAEAPVAETPTTDEG